MPKYKHSGVERNLVKRRLRELSRTRLLPALADRPADVTLRALPSAYGASIAAFPANSLIDLGSVRSSSWPSSDSAETWTRSR